MASSQRGKIMLRSRLTRPSTLPKSPGYHCIFCQQTRSSTRSFAASAKPNREAGNNDRRSFRERLRTALRDTKVEWSPIPIGLGIAFLGAAQFYRVRQREKKRHEEDEEEARSLKERGECDGENRGRPAKRKRVRPSGPW